jgi:spore germination cell wall hydrolase CwlJ-like protein
MIQMERPARPSIAMAHEAAIRFARTAPWRQTMKLSLLLWLTTLMPQPVSDQACLATTVYLEARSQPTIGQLAVAEVALRRRDRGHYGDTVCKVVTAPHQFATTTTSGSFEITNLAAFVKAWDVAGASIHNWQLPVAQRRVVVPHADHFTTLAISPAWSHNKPSITIGDHAFYALN